MYRALSAVLVCALSGCFPQLPDPLVVDDLRVLAIQADPAVATLTTFPPPAVTVRALVVDPDDPDGTDIEHQWALELGDEDFDGFNDHSIGERNVGTPGYEAPDVHGCCTCYTVKVEWNKYIDVEPCEGENGSPTALQLANGDLNLDGGVDVVDLAIMINNWGWTAP